jgi:hypothetical protein
MFDPESVYPATPPRGAPIGKLVYPVFGNVVLMAVSEAGKLVTIEGHPTELRLPVNMPITESYATFHDVER